MKNGEAVGPDDVTAEAWESRLRNEVVISDQQFGFLPIRNTIAALFALRMLMEKFRVQKELHCVFVDLDKAYYRAPREEVCCCMRKSDVAEKYVRAVQDLNEGSKTVVRCVVSVKAGFKVEEG
ncbi:uncharacterized protein LOC119578464 [Penaeus monodon]|uniref:uncharacterized protein LOC119578464 n=1 Tax=Penaeus monodon TaxID=6687 RepID=UPI0018A7AA85|nr:uncharacterized protein LOC119578464 [Penaeus monodon]